MDSRQMKMISRSRENEMSNQECSTSQQLIKQYTIRVACPQTKDTNHVSTYERDSSDKNHLNRDRTVGTPRRRSATTTVHQLGRYLASFGVADARGSRFGRQDAAIPCQCRILPHRRAATEVAAVVLVVMPAARFPAPARQTRRLTVP